MRLNLVSDSLKVRWSPCDRLRVGRLSLEGLNRLFMADADAAELGVELVEDGLCMPCPVVSQLKGCKG